MGGRAPPSRNKRTLRGISLACRARGSPAPEPSSTSAFFTHSLSVCAVQLILVRSRKPLPIARNIRLGDPKPSALRGRGLPVKICLSSCSYPLHFPRSWSLRQTRCVCGCTGLRCDEIMWEKCASVIVSDGAFVAAWVSWPVCWLPSRTRAHPAPAPGVRSRATD